MTKANLSETQPPVQAAVPVRNGRRGWLAGICECACLAAIFFLLSGCAQYAKTGPWAPNGFNYTIYRDRDTGALQDALGLSWQFK